MTSSSDHPATVRIVQKTPTTTMSHREFRRIKCGMTATRVAKIVGYSGTASRYRRRVTRTYDNMPFLRLSSVDFRHGRVISKGWDFPHD